MPCGDWSRMLTTSASQRHKRLKYLCDWAAHHVKSPNEKCIWIEHGGSGTQKTSNLKRKKAGGGRPTL